MGTRAIFKIKKHRRDIKYTTTLFASHDNYPSGVARRFAEGITLWEHNRVNLTGGDTFLELMLRTHNYNIEPFKYTHTYLDYEYHINLDYRDYSNFWKIKIIIYHPVTGKCGLKIIRKDWIWSGTLYEFIQKYLIESDDYDLADLRLQKEALEIIKLNYKKIEKEIIEKDK